MDMQLIHYFLFTDEFERIFVSGFAFDYWSADSNT